MTLSISKDKAYEMMSEIRLMLEGAMPDENHNVEDYYVTYNSKFSIIMSSDKEDLPCCMYLIEDEFSGINEFKCDNLLREARRIWRHLRKRQKKWESIYK